MSDWTLCRWHGAPATLEAALRDLGWFAPGESPPGAVDEGIGGFIPPAGEAPRMVDGIAYAAIVVRDALPTPAGLSETPADLSLSLLGSF